MAGTPTTDATRIAGDLASGARAPWGAGEWASLPREQLLAVHGELAAARRRLDAVLAAASAEIARRSTASDGAGGLARREGYGSPVRLVAAATGGTASEAARLIAVGEATLGDAEHPAPGDGRQAPSATPPYPVLAEAVSDGRVSVDAASAIAAMLGRAADHADQEALAAAERELVTRAHSLPLDRLCAVIRQLEASLDPDALKRAEEARYEARYLNVFENRAGMVVIDGKLDPVSGAPIRAALDAMVRDQLRRRRNQSGARSGESPGINDREAPIAVPDDRTVPQMRADALGVLASHVLKCDARELPLSATTMVVRMGLEQLASGEGIGRIDGTDQPISAGELRCQAANADIIPAVLGGESEVLDLGRKRRLFTPAQSLALYERDGGCASCHAPPSWTETHHIEWWERDTGPTDLKNGVLLCTACHHRIHRDGWEIDVNDGYVWFTPPRSVDPTRTRRRGGRKHFEYVESTLAA